jgi:hypothetical protein
MSAKFGFLLAVALVEGSVAADANGVTVTFVHPETYSNGLMARVDPTAVSVKPRLMKSLDIWTD